MTLPTQPRPLTPSDGTPSPAPDRRSTTEQVRVDHDLAAIGRLTGRRGVLKAVGIGVGVAAATGVLAACSSPPVQSDASATTPADAASSGDSPSPSGTSASSPSSSAAAGGGTPTSEIPVGGGMIFAATKTVVTQPAAGTFKAFDTTCPHAGCAVAKVADGRIDCPCHGSQFDIGTGDRVAGPANTGLTAKTITVTGNTFSVA